MPFNTLTFASPRERFVFAIKWGASAIQIMGYSATGFGLTPWNLYLFLIGVVGWFAGRVRHSVFGVSGAYSSRTHYSARPREAWRSVLL